VKKRRKKIGLSNILQDFLISLHFILKHPTETCIGANNFDTLVPVVARIIFKKDIQHIIYFASDFSENRYKNKFLDYLYLQVERMVIKKADLVISNTKRAEKKRIAYGLSNKKSMVIPNGVELKHPMFGKKEIDKRSFIYVGNVTREHGLLPLLQEIHGLIDHLVVIGQGNQWIELEAFIRDYGLKADLYLAKPHEFVVDYLQRFSGIGLAPYNLNSLWTYYCSPLKVNEYISCGIPVLISDVPEISHVVKEKKLGIVYKKKVLKEISDEIKRFNTDKFYQKSKEFYSSYSYDSLYKDIPFIN
jgi:glycosyltransferase involved in cell wall biosynthesis